MGTRNLTIVKLNGKVRVAQYGQWDGYPTGQGKKIAAFLQAKNFDLAVFKQNIDKIKWATKDQMESAWNEFGSANSMGMNEYDKSYSKKYPEFSRNTAAEILSLIHAGGITMLKNELAFLKDSLFCEWAYELDLDKEVVKIYEGFQKSTKHKDGYGPCKVIKTIPFKEFTVQAMNSLEEDRSKK